MIKAELEFHSSSAPLVLEKIFSLPEVLLPTHESPAEDEVGTRIGDVPKLFNRLEATSFGHGFLRNSNVLYHARKARNGNLVYYGYFNEVSSDDVKCFLVHVAAAGPLFGFACAPEERDRRNRVTTQQGANEVKSWVGRDIRKYVPGLYWLTLLPTALAEQHDVSLTALGRAALEHLQLGRGQHLFRFYERPEDWASAKTVKEMSSLFPGVFDVEKARTSLEHAKTFLELQAILSDWE